MGKRLSISLISILIIFISLSANTQITTPHFKHFSTENGLPSDETYECFQDSKGFLWIATDRGVVRYNGIEFELFTKKNGLPDNVIFHFYEDYKGNIWFISYTGKLSYFNGYSIKEYEHNKIISDKLSVFIKRIQLDSQDNLHVGYNQTGSICISPEGSIIDTHENDTIDGLFIQSDNSNSQPFVFSKVNTKSDRKINLFHIVINGKDIFNEKIDTSIPIGNSNVVNHRNGYLTSIANRLYFINNKLQLTDSITLDSKIIYTLSDGDNYWVSTIGKGITKYSQDNKVLFKCLDAFTISSILPDSEGGYWLSTLENGVYYTSSLDNVTLNKLSGLRGDHITAIIGNGKGEVLFGDNVGNLTIIDNEKPKKLFRVRDYQASIKSFAYNPMSESYFISNGAIYELDSNHLISKFSKESASPNKMQILNLKKNTILSGFTNGISYIGKNEESFKMIDFKKNIYPEITLLARDSTYYLGSIQGLYKLKNDSVINLGNANAFFTERIVDLAQDSTGSVFIATRGRGLMILKDNAQNIIAEGNGLLSNDLTVLYVNKNELWAGTVKGVSVIDINTGEIKYNISTANGLLSNEITGIYVEDEKAYITTRKGVSIINTTTISNKVTDNPFYFISYSINEQKHRLLSTDSIISLSYADQLSEIEFASIGFSNSDQIRYKYKFSGSKNWIETNKNKLQFIGLQPGNYKLEIKVIGDSKNEINTILIHIRPPFYKTIWFLMLTFSITVLLSWLIIRKYFNSKKQQRLLEKDRLLLRQEALASQMNPHFIFNSLNSIQGFIFKNDRKASNQYLAKFSKLMRMTLDNSQNHLITLQEEIEAIELYLNLEQLRANGNFIYSISVKEGINALKVKTPPLLIQPFAENAVWHGLSEHSNGNIEIRIYKKDNLLYFEIEDNGIGRKASQKNNKFESKGAAISERRLETASKLLGGEYRYEIIDKYEGIKATGTLVRFAINFIE